MKVSGSISLTYFKEFGNIYICIHINVHICFIYECRCCLIKRMKKHDHINGKLKSEVILYNKNIIFILFPKIMYVINQK